MNKISKAYAGVDLLKMLNFFAFSSRVWLCAKNSCHLSGGAASLCDTGDVWTQKDQKFMSDIHTRVASETLHETTTQFKF